MKDMICAENLCKYYGEYKALDDLCLTVPEGSVYGLVGPNGAGKTTFIKTLAGIMKADSGKLLIDGAPVFENPAVKKRFAYVSDDLFFFPTFSVKQTAEYYAGMYKNFSTEKYERMKEMFRMDDSRRCRRLSKGMQKQVALICAVCTCPDVLILDEPVDGLDPVMRRNFWSVILEEVCERKMTVLVSSHNLRELEDVCDHVGILYNGKVVLEKALDDVKGSVHKLQLAFSDGMPVELSESLPILKRETFGSVERLIVRGSEEELCRAVEPYRPVVFDILPLTLEEIFIYELGGMGYEFENLV